MQDRLVRYLGLLDTCVTWLEKFAVVVLLFVSAGVLVADIALRTVISVSLAWAPEMTRYAIVWLVFIGGSLAARGGAHISIDVLSEVMPRKAAVGVLQLAAVIAAGTCVAVAIYGVYLVNQMYGFRQTSPSLQWPMWAVYLAVPIGFGLMAVRFIQHACSMSIEERRLKLAATSA